jgi:hypothetical protein
MPSRKRKSRVGVPSWPNKVRVVFSHYHRESATYRTIPRASMIVVVESHEELQRLYDAMWDVAQRGDWCKS